MQPLSALRRIVDGGKDAGASLKMPFFSSASSGSAVVDNTSARRSLAGYLNRRVRIRHNVSVPLTVLIMVPLLALFLLWQFFFASAPQSKIPNFFSHNKIPPLRAINETVDAPFVVGCLEPDTSQPRANAVLVILARNKELDGILDSMHSLERHFNRWYHYPYVFLNDGEFNSTFRESVRNATESLVEFGRIPLDLWDFPSWADPEEVAESIALQGDAAIMYGGMESYHRMCRFYSGKFFKHPLLAKYDWYWRVEPDVKYFCDLTYDPFVYMQQHNKVYGFTIIIKELIDTVPNLFRYASGFMRSHNITSKGMWEVFLENEMVDQGVTTTAETKTQSVEDEYVIPEPEEIDPEAMNGEKYNLCHFWSNFEIASLNFFRSKEYEEFFEFLDRSGGFWHERWGDAPVHSLAAGVFLAPEQVHYFRDIGYRHTTIQHCPGNAPMKQLPRTPYITDPFNRKAIEDDRYWDSWDAERENGVGCRCKCDTDIRDIEGKSGSCLPYWVEAVGGWTSP
ncbi:nucleotide-diphospho-sugar transferase [Lipomyces oligophaga]|uniref:nucleotide-diphospho-sugar transferase n=1 Tax=Lipomyces oligophaga TaxID=45792 RepID=UPI0034CEFC08